jgi:hypothetical protein
MSQREVIEGEMLFSGEKALKELFVACKEILPPERRVSRKGNRIYLSNLSARTSVTGFLENDRMHVGFKNRGDSLDFDVQVRGPLTLDDTTFFGFFAEAVARLAELGDDGEATLGTGALTMLTRRRSWEVTTCQGRITILARSEKGAKLYIARGKIETPRLKIGFRPRGDRMEFTVEAERLTYRMLKRVERLVWEFNVF